MSSPATRSPPTTFPPPDAIEPKDSPAGQYLIEHDVPQSPCSTAFGSRRGNDRVMTRGTFANVRVKNKLATDAGKVREGGWTQNFTKTPSGGDGTSAPIEYIYDAAQDYKRAQTPLVVLAGKDYGMGSSRDWAAKGTYLLGVKAVIAQSYERIHRSNLVFMGVLPLQFPQGKSAEELGLDGTETFEIRLPDPFEPRCDVPVIATRSDGAKIEFTCLARVDTPVEIEYYRNGGILQTVIRKKLNAARQPV